MNDTLTRSVVRGCKFRPVKLSVWPLNPWMCIFQFACLDSWVIPHNEHGRHTDQHWAVCCSNGAIHAGAKPQLMELFVNSCHYCYVLVALSPLRLHDDTCLRKSISRVEDVPNDIMIKKRNQTQTTHTDELGIMLLADRMSKIDGYSL